MPDNPSGQALLMPKLKYRYRVFFSNFGKGAPVLELSKQIKTCGRPKPEFDPIVLDVYNSKVNLLGKPKWSPIEMVIRDDSKNVVMAAVGEQIQKQFDFFEQSSAASGIDYKFVTTIQMLDGGNGNNVPVILETWELYGCMLGSVGYGDLDYAASETIDLSLSITFDNALQAPGGSGVGIGAKVTRDHGSIVAG